MKLLFDTIGTSGSSELKSLLGFIDVDLKISKLKPDLETSTNEIIELIGQEVYDIVLAAYEITDKSEDDKDLIYKVRYPIAVNAYRLYSPSGDVSHTNNGRKMRQDDGEKLPFAWLLDRDNKALEVRFYRAVDEMIKYLDKTDDTELKELWEGSDAFKKSRDLFLYSTALFDDVFTIKSRLLYLMLVPGIRECEEYQIRPLIGIEKYKSLKETIKNNQDFTDEKDADLVRLIRRASAFSAMAWSMPRYSVNLYPEGVLQFYTSDQNVTGGGKPSLKSESFEAKQAFLLDAEKAINEIKLLITPPEIIDSNISLMPNQMFGDNYFSA